MVRETTIKVTVPDGLRITAKDICAHMRTLDQRIGVQLILTISGDGNVPTLEEIKILMDQRANELRRGE